VTDLRRVRRGLIKRREQLEQLRGPVDLPADVQGDYGDRAVAGILHEDSITTRERILAQLEAVDLALERLAEGSWGRCADCGEPIAPKRLQAHPIVETCLRCQERRELEGDRLRGRPLPYPADSEGC
jgi:DnaK suppressor protein